MVVCQFFLRGQCRFGDDCRNEHLVNAQQSSFGSGNSWSKPSATGANAGTKLTLPYTAATIVADLTTGVDKPNWPLSSYAPSKHETTLLTGLDESAEELRVNAYAAIKAGNLNEYLTYEANKISAANQVCANARNNSAQAMDQATKQSQLVPYEESSTNTTSAFRSTANSGSVFPSTTTTPSAFGNKTSAFGTPNSTATTSVFGKPAFGQPAFGQPAFGQTSTPGAATGAFGQPLQNTTAPVSAFGQVQHPTSVFGQPAQAAPTSVFGQPSQPAASSVFGQPAQTSVFGQPAQSSTGSVFGQPSFGQPAPQVSNPLIKPASGAFSAFSGSAPSAFGATATPSTGTTNSTGGGAFSAFAGGQPSAFGLNSTSNNTTSVFGQPSFGQPAPAAPAATQGSVFGAPSVFGQQQQQPATSVFGANPAAPISVFGTPSSTTTAPTSVFGQSAFGSNTNPAAAASQQPNSVFGAGAPVSSAFGGGSAFGAGAAAPSVFGVQQSQPMAPQQQQPAPSISMASSSSMGPLDLSGINTRFPYKPGSTPYDSMLPPNYMEILPQTAKDAFLAEKFEWGKVPEWAPPLEVR